MTPVCCCCCCCCFGWWCQPRAAPRGHGSARRHLSVLQVCAPMYMCVCCHLQGVLCVHCAQRRGGGGWRLQRPHRIFRRVGASCGLLEVGPAGVHRLQLSAPSSVPATCFHGWRHVAHGRRSCTGVCTSRVCVSGSRGVGRVGKGRVRLPCQSCCCKCGVAQGALHTTKYTLLHKGGRGCG